MLYVTVFKKNLVWNRRGPTIEALHKPPPPKPCYATEYACTDSCKNEIQTHPFDIRRLRHLCGKKQKEQRFSSVQLFLNHKLDSILG